MLFGFTLKIFRLFNLTPFYVSDTSVVQLDASDLDFGDNSNVGYVLHSGGRDNFAIDYYTGLVQVAPHADLDIERFGRQYTMTVSKFRMSVAVASGINGLEVCDVETMKTLLKC